MQLSGVSGLEPARRDKLGLCLAKRITENWSESGDRFCRPFQGRAASTPRQHNMNLPQKQKNSAGVARLTRPVVGVLLGHANLRVAK